jgi:dTDP-4-amino-4,6-dideoxygalactose transaminase
VKTEGLSVDLPVSEEILARTITLPMHAGMSRKDAELVVEGVQVASDR